VGGPVGGPVSDPHSPLQATALTRHRAAAIDLDPVAVRWALAPMNADPQRLFRWEPWVRSYLITQELLRPLDFVELRADEAVGSHGTRMVVRDADGAPHALATLIAPPMAVFTGSPDAKPPQRGQIDLVLGWAQLREERQPEILTQLHDQFAFWGSLVPIHTERMRRTREVLEAAIELSVFVQMRFKPLDYSPQVQPMITTPGHGALPSGHCTQAYVVYEVLRALLNCTDSDDHGRRALNLQFTRLVERISMNRVVAGVHFPVDNLAGRLLGTVIGRYMAHRAGAAASVPSASFDGRQVPADQEFDPSSQKLFSGEPTDPQVQPPYYRTGSDIDLSTLPGNGLIGELWERARGEIVELSLGFA
jgi:hypothetical protein